MKSNSLLYCLKLFLCVTVLLVLILPSIQWHFKLFNVKGVQDKRTIAEFDNLDLSGFNKIPSELNRYVEDNYGFRTLLIKAINSIRYYVFHISSTGDVLIGKNNWLFYSSPNDGQILRDYKKNNLYSDFYLKNIARVLVNRRNLLRKMGSEFIIVLVPNKGSVYPEYLPDKFKRYKGKSRYDALVNYLEKNTDLNVIAIKRDLLQFKVELGMPLYSIKGTHWNSVGSFIGYLAVSKKMKRIFPNIILKDWSDYTISHGQSAQELNDMLGIFFNTIASGPLMVSKKPSKRYSVRPNDRTIITNDGDHSKLISKAVIFGDSFFQEVGKYLFPHFKEAHFFWTLRYNQQVAINESPDIVIQEVVERYLDNLYQ